VLGQVVDTLADDAFVAVGVLGLVEDEAVQT